MIASLAFLTASTALALVALGPAKVLATVAMGACLAIGVGPVKDAFVSHVQNVRAFLKKDEIQEKIQHFQSNLKSKKEQKLSQDVILNAPFVTASD